MIYEIPCAPGGQAQWTQRTTLDGRDYLLTFDWNQRGGHWSLSIADQDGASILAGITLVTNWPLLRGLRASTRPPGELLVIDTLDRGEDPGFADLGGRFVLAYLTQDELA